MKFVITGGLGHIGSLLIRKLDFWYPNSDIVIIDNLQSERYCSLFNLPKASKKYFINENLCDLELQNIFKNSKCVFHLAAITNAAASFENAKEVENNNFNATKKVALACEEKSVPMIYISSTSVYGTSSKKVDENCPKIDLKPQSPYAESKLKEENFLKELSQSSHLEMVILRFGTIFGISPGMRFHTAVNKFCFQASFGKPLTVWTTAYEQLRPYLYLEDAMQAFKILIDQSLFDKQIYNVLTGNYSVKNIIDEIRFFYPNLEIKFVDSKIMNQLSYEVLFDKFKSKGFAPENNIKKGIQETLKLLENN